MKIARPFLQFFLFAFALGIALTRVADYRHHPTDVVTGIVVGLFFAAIILLFLADIINRPISFQTHYKQVSDDVQEVNDDIGLDQVVVED